MPEVKNRLPAFINSAITAFEDPTGLDRPRWGDYSYWQRVVDAVISKRNGVKGGIFRATRGQYYKDPYFKVNYDAFKQVDLYAGGYHVIYPHHPVVAQIDNFYSVYPETDTVPKVLDLEVSGNQSKAKISDVTRKCVELLRSRDGRDPMIYTRYALADSWLADWSDDELNSLWWWLAQYLFAGYLEHPGPPTLPNKVLRDKVVLHQTSDHKLAPPGEVASRAVDWDRWEIGNELEMHAWISDNWGDPTTPPPIDPPPSEEIEPISHRVVTANWLNMRSKPEAGGLDLGTLKQDSDVSITEQVGEWGKVEGWIHLGYTRPYP